MLDGVDLNTYGSRGQQRLAVLALKLAEADWMRAEIGELPVVLLDDVLSELDPQRREYVLQRVARTRADAASARCGSPPPRRTSLSAPDSRIPQRRPALSNRRWAACGRHNPAAMNILGMGPMELMLIVVLALIVFGPAKLPEIMGQVGKAIGDFRRATSELSDEFNDHPGRAAGDEGGRRRGQSRR